MTVLHYIHPLEMQPEDMTWCGRDPSNPERVTTDHEKATCRTCRRAIEDACGVTTRTLARWATGELRPTALRLADVRARLRRRGLALPALPQTEEREREP